VEMQVLRFAKDDEWMIVAQVDIDRLSLSAGGDTIES
jgi:hypothetical protein